MDFNLFLLLILIGLFLYLLYTNRKLDKAIKHLRDSLK